MSKQLFWYFSANDKRLRYADGREIRLGSTHKVDCKPVLCESGLHASRRAIDALKYAPGNVVWRVRLGGDVVHSDDKSCATERTYVSGGVDVSADLRLFARQCALEVAHLWNAPRFVLNFLETGNESIRAAAWAAAGTAAWAAARAAARAAAGDAAGDAARDAAGAAAGAAAWAAAGDAAWAAAGDAAGAAAWAAAGTAAWAAAGDAAGAAQNKRLTRLLTKAIKDAGR